MKRSKLKYLLLALSSLFIFSATTAQQKSSSLKDAFKADFLIGTALGAHHILEKDPKANELIMNQFNAITAENHMKSMNIHPEWNRYDFFLGDKFVEYGQKNNMYIVGHTLIWHSQLPRFVGKIKSADSLKLFMTDHINTVAGRYIGKIDSWDVINEAIEDDGTFRKSIFYKLLGEDFIKMSFDLAAKADPKAELYYNDYNNEQPIKRKATIEMIKKLKASGTKIDGVGIQGHWSINSLKIQDIEDAIVEYAALGLKVAFTELDLTVLPNPWDLKGADVNQNFENNPKMNPYPKELPDSVQTTLAQKYEELFKVFLKHQDKIDRITFWGVADGHSWLNGWPVRGRTNYPLLFDRNFEPKKAYQAVMNLKNTKPNL
jgi:endo-1,4-beta-xylanase